MICSKKNNFLFIAVAKSGTVSIENYICDSLLGKFNILRNNYIYSNDEFKNIYWSSKQRDRCKYKLHKHSRFSEILQTPYAWDDQYKFAFVRNPYDRVVSWYCFLSQILTSKQIQEMETNNNRPGFITGSFVNFCRSAPFWVFNNQFFHLCDEEENIKIDFIGSYENLNEDFKFVCNKIGIPQVELPYKNKTNHNYYTEYYNDETRNIVETKYAKDIEYFKYKF